MVKALHILAIFSIFFSVFNFAIALSPALATNGGGGAPVGGGGTPGELQPPTKYKTFEELISAIARWLVRLLVPLAAIMIIYAGFLFLTAGGDTGKITTARQALTWAMVGIAIVLIGEGLTYVIRDILGVQ